MTELGCPATDKGPNQPNVFSDPKSTEGALPWFSSGGRSDLAQQRLLVAHHRHWSPAGGDFDEAANPVSILSGERMVDPKRLYVWAWDARPYPAFPLRGDLWSDNGNWHYGHWLNGRLANPTTGELVNAILADHGLPAADVEGADGMVHGYVIDEPTSARGAIEPIADLFGLAVLERQDGLAFRSLAEPGPAVEIADVVSDGRDPVVEAVRDPDHQLPAEAVLSFRDPLVDYQAISVRSVRSGAPGRRQHAIGFPGVLDAGQGRALIGDWLRRAWAGRERVSFAVPQPDAGIVPGAVVRLPGRAPDYLVTAIEDGLVRRVSATQIVRATPLPWHSATPGAVSIPPMIVGRPLALFLDLPSGLWAGGAEQQFRVAAWQAPWTGQAVFVSPESTGFSHRATLVKAAYLGVLAEPLLPGAIGRIDRARAIMVALYNGAVSSVSRTRMLNGANLAAVRSVAGGWEIVQFETAEEIAPNVWCLSGLLRGLLGTDDQAAAGADAGAHFVLLDEAVVPAGLLAGEIGLELNWRIGRIGSDLSGESVSEYAGAGGVRALTPLSPVHLRAKQDDGDVLLSWVRRGRIDADSWTAADIPLGEEREEYRVEIAHAGGALVRTATAATPVGSPGTELEFAL